MTQQSTKKEYSTFVKGIVTEAGPLTFPENASLDEENCVLNRDGSRQRRLGMDFENDYVLRNATVLPDDAVASFRWFNAANKTENQLAVVQTGELLHIFNASAPSVSAALITTVDISAYTTGKTTLQVSSGMGYLFCTGGKSTPFYLDYNAGAGTVVAVPINLKVRDFFGVEDSLAVETQPVSLTTAHDYNLRNQGWNPTQISAFFASQSKYPANNQQWFIGKDTNDDFQPPLLQKQQFGSTPAPRGRYVIDAFARSAGRQAASGLTTATDTETSYPTTVAFSHERVFYAGSVSTPSTDTTVPNYTGYVFFSRTMRNVKDAAQCHSDADPTSEIDSILVATDGGTINIPNSGKIHKLTSTSNGVIVYTEQGIWGIFGGQGGFIADDYQVVKITDFGVLSHSSIVEVEDSVMYWNRGGVYYIAPSQNTGGLVATNITEGTIQTYYNSLDLITKRTAVGSYDPVNRKVSWMFNDELTYTGETFRNKYTRELVLDMTLTSWYKNSISAYLNPSPYIAGYLETPDFLLREEGVRTRGDSVTKYLVVQFVNPLLDAASVSFAYYRDESFRDWKGLDGVGASFSSFLITGYEIAQDTTRQKQSPYFICHFKQTEKNAILVGPDIVVDNPSGCLVQAQWDWSNSPTSGKWGQQFQAYRLQHPYVLQVGPIDYGYEVVTTKSRLPGRGKALSLFFQSDGDKDFYIYGWALTLTGNSYV